MSTRLHPYCLRNSQFMTDCVTEKWYFETELDKCLLHVRIVYFVKLRLHIAHVPCNYSNTINTSNSVKPL